MIINAKNGATTYCAGIFMIILGVLLFFIAVASETGIFILVAIVLFIIGSVSMKGVFQLNPNEARVMMLFGSYRGTVKDNGILWVNPLYTQYAVSLKAMNE